MTVKRFIAVPALGLIVLGLGAYASSATNAPQAVVKLEVNEAGEYVFDDDDYRNEVVCKRQRVSGSHVPRRVCKMRAQLEKERQAVMDALGPLAGDELQRYN